MVSHQHAPLCHQHTNAASCLRDCHLPCTSTTCDLPCTHTHPSVLPTTNARYLEKSQVDGEKAHKDEGCDGATSARTPSVPRLSRSTRVIELGAGTGVAGIAAAVLLRHNDPSARAGAVLLTDVAAAVPGLRHTIELNMGVGDGTEGPLPVTAGALDWTRCDEDLRALGETEPFDVVVAADVVWVAHLIRPFVTTLLRVTAPGSVVVFGYQSRSSAADRELFGLLATHFDVNVVDDNSLDPVYRATGTVTVYLLVRRAPSDLPINAEL